MHRKWKREATSVWRPNPEQTPAKNTHGDRPVLPETPLHDSVFLKLEYVND